MALVSPTDRTAAGYDCLAPYYDQFTAGYAYDRWLEAIERRARALGLRGGRALDLACGTGKSAAELLGRGYSVRGIDLSAAMIEVARRTFPDEADAFTVGDMRSLPPLGDFDFVLCLDDAINYLLSERELAATFEGVSRALAPGGVFVFDVNSLLTYRTSFAEVFVRDGDGILFIWRGEAGRDFEPCEIATASVEIFIEGGGHRWERRSMQHVQRHHPPGVVLDALRRAGLECAALVGQHPGAELVDEADDRRHIKLVYFVRHEEVT